MSILTDFICDFSDKKCKKNRDIMYNLNLSLAETAANAVNNLLIETNGPTPRTPEILNSLIAMTNPLDNYFGDGSHKVSYTNSPLILESKNNFFYDRAYLSNSRASARIVIFLLSTENCIFPYEIAF